MVEGRLDVRDEGDSVSDEASFGGDVGRVGEC